MVVPAEQGSEVHSLSQPEPLPISSLGGAGSTASAEDESLTRKSRPLKISVSPRPESRLPQLRCGPQGQSPAHVTASCGQLQIQSSGASSFPEGNILCQPGAHRALALRAWHRGLTHQQRQKLLLEAKWKISGTQPGGWSQAAHTLLTTFPAEARLPGAHAQLLSGACH